MHYLDNKLLGRYFKSKSNKTRGIIPANGRYIEYVVIEGNPLEGSMLEIFSIDNGIAYVRVNDFLIEETEDYIVI